MAEAYAAQKVLQLLFRSLEHRLYALFRIYFALGGPLVEDKFILGECPCFVAEEVVNLTKVLMHTVVLDLAGF